MLYTFYLQATNGTISSGIVLGNDAGKVATITGDLPSQTRLTESEPLYEADFAKHFSLGNKVNVRVFNAERTHADYGAAFTFKETHAGTVHNSGVLEMTYVPPSGSNVVLYLRNAVIESVNCVKYSGLTTVFKYSIKGGLISATAS